MNGKAQGSMLCLQDPGTVITKSHSLPPLLGLLEEKSLTTKKMGGGLFLFILSTGGRKMPFILVAVTVIPILNFIVLEV